ncbi:MAG: alpha/beta fold hydrolase [Myxococcota bacterium]
MTATRPQLFDLSVVPFRLEGGVQLPQLHLRGFSWGPATDDAVGAHRLGEDDPAYEREHPVRRSRAELAAMPPPARAATTTEVPTVLIVHALTADARVGGPGGWWAPLCGSGQPFDPDEVRILCFNNLGSCYGSYGPADEGFPRLRDEPPPSPFTGKGAFALDPDLPATITSWDQARAILLGLDALGIDRIDMVTGGSVGGMVTLCLAALAPKRFRRVVPVATSARSNAWLRGWNHIARMAILADPGYPASPDRGLELARQVAHMTYRSESGLGTREAARGASWHPQDPLGVQTYLEHQGAKLRNRFYASAYLSQLTVMDHHDLSRPPGSPSPGERWTPDGPWGEERIQAPTLAIAVDSDQLFFAHHSQHLVETLSAAGRRAECFTIRSPHGHDAFLLEWDQLREAFGRAWNLPPQLA